MNKWVRWQDWVAVAAGAYAALSVIWTRQEGASLLMLMILGIALAGSGLWSLAMPGLVSMEWVHIGVGVLLLIAPRSVPTPPRPESRGRRGSAAQSE